MEKLFLLFFIGNFTTILASGNKYDIEFGLKDNLLNEEIIDIDDLKKKYEDVDFLNNPEDNKLNSEVEIYMDQDDKEVPCYKRIGSNFMHHIINFLKNNIMTLVAILFALLIEARLSSWILIFVNVLFFGILQLVRILEGITPPFASRFSPFKYIPVTLQGLKYAIPVVMAMTIIISSIYMFTNVTSPINALINKTIDIILSSLFFLLNFMKNCCKNCLKKLLKKIFHHHHHHKGHHHHHHHHGHHGHKGHHMSHHHYHKTLEHHTVHSTQHAHAAHQTGAHGTGHSASHVTHVTAKSTVHSATHVAQSTHHILTHAHNLVHVSHAISGKVVGASVLKAGITKGGVMAGMKAGLVGGIKAGAMKSGFITVVKIGGSLFLKAGIGAAIAHAWPVLLPIAAVGGCVYLYYKTKSGKTIVRVVNITESNKDTWQDEYDIIETVKEGEIYYYGASSKVGNEVESVFISDANVYQNLQDLAEKFKAISNDPTETHALIENSMEFTYEFVTEQIDEGSLKEFENFNSMKTQLEETFDTNASNYKNTHKDGLMENFDVHEYDKKYNEDMISNDNVDNEDDNVNNEDKMEIIDLDVLLQEYLNGNYEYDEYIAMAKKIISDIDEYHQLCLKEQEEDERVSRETSLDAKQLLAEIKAKNILVISGIENVYDHDPKSEIWKQFARQLHNRLENLDNADEVKMTYVVELKDKLLKNDHERRRLLQLEEDNEDRNLQENEDESITIKKL